MTLHDLLPALTPLLAGTIAVGAAHFFRALANRAVAKAKTTADKNDDIVAQRWYARAMWLEVAVLFTVKYFVPAALAPRDDDEPLQRTPGIERVEGEKP